VTTGPWIAYVVALVLSEVSVSSSAKVTREINIRSADPSQPSFRWPSVQASTRSTCGPSQRRGRSCTTTRSSSRARWQIWRGSTVLQSAARRRLRPANLIGRHRNDNVPLVDDVAGGVLARVRPVMAGVTADIGFYVGLAREADGPVVELAIGSGRVAVPVAAASTPLPEPVVARHGAVDPPREADRSPCQQLATASATQWAPRGSS
jgi:hypothetical protein